jgi:hypothetical protein
LVVGGAASANMAGDCDVAEPASGGRGQLLDVAAAPIALVIPKMTKRLDDGSPTGAAFGAHDARRVAEQYLRPDLLHVGA